MAAKFWETIRARFAGISNTVAMLTVIILTGIALVGVFGAPKIITENIIGMLCAILGVTTLFIYEIWYSQKQTSKSAESINATLAELVDGKSPYNVRSTHIGAELNEMIEGAERWMFKGGSGRWQRSTVLPTLSLVKNVEIPYLMLILDPRSKKFCEEYANYRNRHRADSSTSTWMTVRNEVLACIVASAWYLKQSRIVPEVHLAQTYSPLRQDFSDTKAAITISDPNESGLFIPKTSWYYQSLVDEFNQARRRSPKVCFKNIPAKMPPWENLDSHHVQSILTGINVKPIEGSIRPILDEIDLSASDLKAICELVFKGRSH